MQKTHFLFPLLFLLGEDLLKFGQKLKFLKDESRQMHCPGLVSIYRRHNYIYLLRFKVLMEPIILVFIKLIGTAISGHWDLRDTGTT